VLTLSGELSIFIRY